MLEQSEFKKIGTFVKVLPFDIDNPERSIFLIDSQNDQIYSELNLVNSALLVGYSGYIANWDKVSPNSYESSYTVSVRFMNGETYTFLPEDLEITDQVTPEECLPTLYEVSEGTYKPLSKEEKATAEKILLAFINNGKEYNIVDDAINLAMEFHDSTSQDYYRAEERKLVKKLTNKI